MLNLSEDQKEAIQASEMDPAERKRQYAALGRAIKRSANPALVLKYENCSDSERRLGQRSG